MSNKVFVGNLPWSVTEDDLGVILSDLDLGHRSVKVVLNRDTGQSRGFAFVEFEGDGDAKHAIEVLNGYQLDGRVLFVNEARRSEHSQERGKQGDFGFKDEPRGDYRKESGNKWNKGRQRERRSPSGRRGDLE
jgi:RNA recognition motif-containing protein